MKFLIAELFVIVKTWDWTNCHQGCNNDEDVWQHEEMLVFQTYMFFKVVYVIAVMKTEKRAYGKSCQQLAECVEGVRGHEVVLRW